MVTLRRLRMRWDVSQLGLVRALPHWNAIEHEDS